jgi:hypothetical protein
LAVHIVFILYRRSLDFVVTSMDVRVFVFNPFVGHQGRKCGLPSEHRRKRGVRILWNGYLYRTKGGEIGNLGRVFPLWVVSFFS